VLLIGGLGGCQSLSPTPYDESAQPAVGVTQAAVTTSCIASFDLGTYHSCAAKVDGTVWCWGNNAAGELGIPSAATLDAQAVLKSDNTPLTGVVQVATGTYHTCARTSAGTVYCWGSAGLLGDGTSTTRPRAALVTGLSAVADLAVGGDHTCARKTDGTLWCWGTNSKGQLGDGTTTNQLVPVQTGAGTLGNAVAEVALGYSHSCARKTDGTLWCWGSNDSNQLGTSASDSSPHATPFQIGASTLGNAVAQVGLGSYHTCARKTDGTLWCWGYNWYGQVGNGSYTTPAGPVQSGASTLGSAVADVGLGSHHTCARKTDGTLWCWGYNAYGQVGAGNTIPTQPTPLQAAATTLGSAVAEFALGYYHTCARRTDDTYWCWGDNSYGELSYGKTAAQIIPIRAPGLSCNAGDAICGVNETHANSPTDCPTSSCGDGNCDPGETPQSCPADCKMVVGASLGDNHSCARKADNTLWCWGDNAYNQLGDGTNVGKFVPIQAGATTLGSSVAEVALGNNHSCARKTDGTLWCWGSNTSGQLGDNTLTWRSTPVQAGSTTLGSGVAQVALGKDYSCARKTDGTLWCWGYNLSCQLGDNTSTDRKIPVRTGSTTLGSAVAQVSVGQEHGCARKTNGTLWCWGRNSGGQLGDGTTTTRCIPVQAGTGTLGTAVAQFAVGGTHSCAIKTDGTLWCWGYNDSGQLGDGTTVNKTAPVQVTALGNTVAEVALGYSHTCARKTDGTIWCWGYNSLGELGDGTSTNRTTPVQAASELVGNSAAQIVAGNNHNCVRKTDGTFWCWGANSLQQLGFLGGYNTLQPAQVPWCGDGICSVAERDQASCAPDCTPTNGNGVCDPYLNCSITSLASWECDTDCP
jgi:alpha-tubulin suppressor-like RCC1 family protein